MNLHPGMIKQIETAGFTIQNVFDPVGTIPTYSYSIGASAMAGGCEFFISGLRDDNRCNIINVAINHIGFVGDEYQEGKRDTDISDLPSWILPVTAEAKATHAAQAGLYWGNDDYQAFQIVWPDRAGLFPWQTGYDHEFCRQEILCELPALLKRNKSSD